MTDASAGPGTELGTATSDTRGSLTTNSVATRPVDTLTADRVATLAGILVLAVGLLGAGLNVGFLALSIAVVLQLFFPASSAGALGRVSWEVIVLITGVVTYIAMLERAGTMDVLGAAVAGVAPPILGLLLLLCGVRLGVRVQYRHDRRGDTVGRRPGHRGRP